MKKSAIVAASLFLVLMLMIVMVYAQEDMAFVSNEGFDNPRRGPAVFPHDEHNEMAQIDDCAVCHHVYDDNGQLLEDESSEDQACVECHGNSDEGRKPKLIKAYHLNCKNCHMEARKGPVLCAQCHV